MEVEEKQNKKIKLPMIFKLLLIIHLYLAKEYPSIKWTHIVFRLRYYLLFVYC